MKKGMKYLLFGLCAGGMVIGLSTSASALTGVCSDCHTMHNSQDGANLATTPQLTLIRFDNGCLGCHQGANTTTANLALGPKVYDPNILDETTSLAGGNFGWVDGVAGVDSNGHNVVDIAASTDLLGNTPPGGTGALASQLSCASPTTGCHQGGAHHTNETGQVAFTGGEAVGGSYRFLMPLGGAQGVSGFEDPNYEAAAGVTGSNLGIANHNQYKSAVTAAAGTDTISAFCGSCHGNFHTVVGAAGAWTRHPTDYDLNATAAGTEYRSYNVAGATTGRAYSTAVPVGSTTITAVKSEVLLAAGDAIVTCVSCHRAHGSPNADMLRFAYNMDAHTGASNNGCFVCHTTKDDPVTESE